MILDQKIDFGKKNFFLTLSSKAEKQKKISSFSKCFQKIVIVAKTNH